MKKDRLSHQEVTLIGSITGTAGYGESGEMVLKVLRGKGAGKTFSFAFGQNVIIGRHEESHIQLDHKLVSRHHTKINWKGSEPWVIDLNSTNGTFLNNQKIEEALIQEGDEIRIGNSALKIHFQMGEDGEKTRLTHLLANAEELLKKVEDDKDQWGRIFSGSLGKMNLSEILQSLCMAGRDGILVIRGLSLGKVYIRKGRIFFARAGKIVGKKALFRLLAWKRGYFDLRDLEDELVSEVPENRLKKYEQGFPKDITHTLLEFLKGQDEFQPIAERIPKLKHILAPNPKNPFPKDRRYVRVCQIYEKVGEGISVQKLLDSFPLLDTEIFRVLVYLVDHGFLLEKPR